MGYGKNTRHALEPLARQFEDSLLHINRGAGSERYFVVPLTEAGPVVTGSRGLRRPSPPVEHGPLQAGEREKVATERWSWLLSTWVPRALENALLTYSTRILGQEIRLGR